MANNFSLAQCLYNASSYSPKKVVELLKLAEESEGELVRLTDGVAIDARPVRTAVERATKNLDLITDVCALYIDYTELFVDSMRDIMHSEVVIAAADDKDEILPPTYAVSQRISGDINIVSGIVASENVFLKLAARYSGENFAEVDELAIDSLVEYINVLNGLFCVELANRHIDAELELPSWKKDAHPEASNQLKLKVYTAFGAFYLIMAVDEFLGY